MSRPYKQTHIYDGGFLREFAVDVDDKELVWHRDKKKRLIEVIEGEGWLLQCDNQLPRELKVGDRFGIFANTYHRLFKGTSNLKIKIHEEL